MERGESRYNEWNVCVDSNEVFTYRPMLLYVLFHNLLGTWKEKCCHGNIVTNKAELHADESRLHMQDKEANVILLELAL